MDNTKDLLTRTALRMFRSKPYNDVSLSQIVKEVGVTKGSFFHHFRSKEEIFRAAVNLFYSNGMLDYHDETVCDSLWLFCEDYIAAFWSNDTEYPIDGFGSDILFLSEACRRIPDFAQMDQERRRKEEERWIQVIDKAKADGEIKCILPSIEIARIFLMVEDSILLDGFIFFGSYASFKSANDGTF